MIDWLQQELDRPYNEAASLFPLLEGDDFKRLKVDIAANGLLEAIWLHPDGSILDGRNRHRACIETEIEPRFRTWEGRGSTVAFVVSMNLHRRHLTYDQRVGIALKLEPAFAEEAKKRQLAVLMKGSKVAVGPNSAQRVGRAAQRAAEQVKVGKTAVKEMKAIQRDDPDLAAKLIAGETTVRKERKAAEKRKRALVRPRITPANKSPRLIVAYAESMPQLRDESVDLIVTSPPYNLGADNWPMGGGGRTPRANGVGFNDERPERAYQVWQIECLREMYRIARVGASLFYNHKVRNRAGEIVHPFDWLRSKENPWIIRQEIIWDRGSTHNHSPTLFWPEDERIYWMTKGKPALPDRPIGVSTIWRFHGPVANTWHPAPFSEELPRRCIEAVGRNGIIVLDPFAGSCTTPKVALEYGYEAIGVDVCGDYLKRAAEENGWTKPSAA